MKEDRPDIPEETARLWHSLAQVAPEPLPASASKRIERALAAAQITRGDLASSSRKVFAAAVVIALAAGTTAGIGIGAARESRSAAGVEHKGQQYLLLVHDNEAVNNAVRDEGMEVIVERYSAWARGLAEQGRLVSAEHLAPATRWIGGAAPQVSMISGYFVIRAESFEAAADIARMSPHVQLGGIMEVRGIERAGE